MDMLEIEFTCIITRQLKYHKMQLKYPENITHDSRRTFHTHYILEFNLAFVISFVTGKALWLRR